MSVYNGNITNLKYYAETRENNPLIESMLGEDPLREPVYNGVFNMINGYTFCLDSLWGNQIEVKSYNRTGNSYSGVLEFTLYDHFGLDAPDVEKFGFLAGFRAWYILQHFDRFNGAYKPFVTVINFEVPFSGSF